MPDRKKPKTVLHAEWALWIWTAYACLDGLYDSWRQMPEMAQAQQSFAAQIPGLAAFDIWKIFEAIAGGYAVIAATSVWIIFKIGDGRRWARASLLVGFILDLLWTAMPPSRDSLYYLSAIPDLGLQIAAIHWLYSAPGKFWFAPQPAVPAWRMPG